MAIPSRLGPYELGPELGRGSMGVVFRAVDQRLRREVALKILTGVADEAALEDFIREARAAARLRHPGIVVVYGAEVIDGLRVVALELVDGGSLRDRLRRHGALPSRDAARVIAELALAVQAAHVEGVVHRDLKPANVLLEKDGRPRLTDFGLARDDRAGLRSASGDIIGTPAYMSPEQARGDVRSVGPWTDVWGLGAVLFECLTGQPPYPGKDAPDVLRRIVLEEPPSLAAVRRAAGLEPLPEDLVTVCAVALEKDPRRRYASAAALEEDLRRWLDGRPILARPPGRLRRLLALWRRHRRAALAGVAVAAVTAVAVGVLPGLVSRGRREREWTDLLARVGVAPGAVAREKVLDELGRDAGAAPVLVAALQAVTTSMEAATHARLLAVLDATTDDERARQSVLAPLPEALARAASARPDERLARADVRAIDEARRRVALRDGGARPSRPESILAAEHRARVGDDGLLRASVAVEALGRLGVADDAVIDAVGRYLHVEEDEERGLIAAAALGRLRDARALRVVVRLEERHARGGSFLHRALRAAARELAGTLPAVVPPRVALEHLDRARLRGLLDDEVGALVDLDRALELDPKDDLAWACRASMHLGRQDWKAAAADLARALELEPDDPEHLASHAFAVAHLPDGGLDLALAGCDRALTLDPFDASAWNARGFVRGKRGDVGGALADLSRAIELDPRFAEPFTNRASIKAEAGDRTGAIEDHSRALALNPDLGEVWNNRGVAKHELGDFEGALTDLTRATELKPRDALVWTNRGLTLLARRDFAGAIADTTMAIELRPEVGLGYEVRGRARIKASDLEGARADLQRALELAPGGASGWNAWGLFCMIVGDPAGAVKAFTRQVELGPEEHGAYSSRGFARLKAGDVHGALEDCRRAVELEPGDAASWRNLAEALEANQDPAGALDAMSRAVTLQPESASGWRERAKFRLILDQLDAALLDAQRAVDIDPRDASNVGLRGAVHRARGDRPAAIRDFERMIELMGEGHPDADAIRGAIDELRGG